MSNRIGDEGTFRRYQLSKLFADIKIEITEKEVCDRLEYLLQNMKRLVRIDNHVYENFEQYSWYFCGGIFLFAEILQLKDDGNKLIAIDSNLLYELNISEQLFKDFISSYVDNIVRFKMVHNNEAIYKSYKNKRIC